MVSAHQHRRIGDPLVVDVGSTADGRQLAAADEALDRRDEAQFVDVGGLHLVDVIVPAVGADGGVDGVTSKKGDRADENDADLAVAVVGTAVQPASVALLQLRVGTECLRHYCALSVMPSAYLA